MNFKLLFVCLFFVVLLIPAESKKDEKKRYKHRHRHPHGHHPPDKKHGRYEDIIQDAFFQLMDMVDGPYHDDDDDDDDDGHNFDWIFDLQEPEGLCDPNPCLNGGVCEEKDKGRNKKKFKCDCPKPFKGKKCERAPRRCKPGICGRGECVLTSSPPFFGCKCKEPFQPPYCREVAVCEPNPCKNGGNCIRDGNDFDCECPAGYWGRFCNVGPDDCFVDDGESYRGNVSVTEDGHECLPWNSHFILDEGTDPFSDYGDVDGLGHHNLCRNPDGDLMPWCFFRKGRKLKWDYCNVTECPEPTGVPPTDVAPTGPEPTDPQPKPTDAKPTDVQPTPPQPKPTDAEPTDVQPTPPQPKPTDAKPTDVQPTPPQPIPTDAKPTPSKPTGPEPSPEKPTEVPEPTTATAQTNATAEPQQFSTCGKPTPTKIYSRIWGGLKAIPGALPWQVSLQVRHRGSSLPFRHICGGVLIDSCWVLTAAHCLDQQKDMQVVVGGLRMDLEGPNEQTLGVEQAIRHERYMETPTAVYNDIALLKLRGTDGRCANESQFVKAACLPDAPLPDGKECTISGWGATEESDYGSNSLLDAKVLLINQEKCSDDGVYGNVLDDSMFCAGHLQGGVDSCQGDSGGPLTCEQGGTHVIYGLVSWGDSCGKKNKPGVYTRVTHFLDWIKAKKQAA